MKKSVLKVFVFGILIVLVLQVGVLLILEYFYFPDNSAYSAVKIESSLPKSNKPIYLEGNISNISNSFDGQYISYLKNNKISIVNVSTGQKDTISSDGGKKISCYTWIYDRNRLIIAEKSTSSRYGYFSLYYYDISDKNKVEIYNTVNNNSVRIPVNSSSEYISQISMSTLTNQIYLRITDANNLSRIYNVSIMAQSSNVYVSTKHIDSILQLKQDDILYYQNSYTDMVYKCGNRNPVKIENHSNLKLLGGDLKDNVYLALMDKNNKTNTIYSGSIADYKYTKFTLKQSINPDNILMNQNGDIYYNDTGASHLLNLKTGKILFYSGKVIGIFSNGFISEYNSQVIINPI